MTQVHLRIVFVLGTIDQRAALDSQLAAVVGHLLTGLHQSWLHIEMKFHHVTLFPSACDRGIAFGGDGQLLVDELGFRDGFAVQSDSEVELLAVGIFVEATGGDLSAHPSGNAEHEANDVVFLLFNRQSVISVPPTLRVTVLPR